MKSAPTQPVIQKEILRDKICEVLKAWILDGTLKPGERIVESVLAARLKVSRAPFREALWLLARHGLVTLRAHHGASVVQLHEEDVREIFEIREALETYCARKIHASLSPAKVARLQEALGRLETAALKRDMKAFSEGDLAFHTTLSELADNRRVEEILRDTSTRFFGYELILDLPKAADFRFEAVLEDHRRMVRLILEGTDEEIDRGFRLAFAAFRDYLLERFRSGPRPPRETSP
jgi:DNA-binding GntR family transcriptional regulator